LVMDAPLKVQLLALLSKPSIKVAAASVGALGMELIIRL